MSAPSTSPLIRNAWYAAATSAEVGRTLLGRHLLGTPVVLYRTEAGEPVALLDACAHRQFPLSRSALVGDDIRCGYHGFTFASSGECVHIPSSPRIPRDARVQRFPLAERHDMLWIWPGDPALADPSLIPDCPWLDGSAKVSYYAHLRAHYQLLIENLLDFSHVPYVHHDQQGHPELARVIPRAREHGDTVVSTRVMRESSTPPLWSDVMGLPLGAPMDHDQRFEFRAPSAVCIRQAVWASQAPERRYPFSTTHFMTPDGCGATHYWSWVSLEWEGVDPATLERMDRGAREVADQDVIALEAQQALHDRLRDGAVAHGAVSVPFDAGSLLTRQVLARMAEREREAAREPRTATS
ncbi:MAG: hypothetical protein ABS43_05380 [Bordetella sp. SCN 67-23]|nr:aromatic ring-hydroxylating dioxygenase subunit alpha [Burkholderiales bacterium]ODS75453.1 MAG: hypothetical protein ABS43_05380 [Bordetella sp. SCN 67-23]ODU94027.1 MAG: hypothetical protein ABT00_04555 [Bordetella sp. SCN 68-11]OJW87897.1 MAG: hypothetical protein BGO71_11115 [Burkholderiales bacterium 67-32]